VIVGADLKLQRPGEATGGSELGTRGGTHVGSSGIEECSLLHTRHSRTLIVVRAEQRTRNEGVATVIGVEVGPFCRNGPWHIVAFQVRSGRTDLPKWHVRSAKDEKRTGRPFKVAPHGDS
jgi:hypothetical protein